MLLRATSSRTMCAFGGRRGGCHRRATVRGSMLSAHEHEARSISTFTVRSRGEQTPTRYLRGYSTGGRSICDIGSRSSSHLIRWRCHAVSRWSTDVLLLTASILLAGDILLPSRHVDDVLTRLPLLLRLTVRIVRHCSVKHAISRLHDFASRTISSFLRGTLNPSSKYNELVLQTQCLFVLLQQGRSGRG